jgi:hypothetical protein
MSFQCDDEDEGTIVVNNFKATVSDANLTLNDTLWITGKMSSQAFDEALGDSIPYSFSNRDFFSVFRLKSADNEGNSMDAVNNFETINESGIVSDPGVCPNSGILVEGILSDDSSEYAYRVGLKPTIEGDYVLSWNFDTNITNTDRNTEILANYPVDGNSNTIEFNTCGIISVLPNIEASERLYFFSVE